MKTHTFRTTLLAACFSVYLLGCGDDDDREAGSPNPEPPPIDFDESAFAANKIYTAQIAGQNEPITLTFPAPGEYEMVQAGVIETGTLSGATREVNRWTVKINPSVGSPEGAQEGVLQLDFTAPDSGAWTFTSAGGAHEAGTFIVTSSGYGPDGNAGEPDDDDRTALTGKTLEITYPGGGRERFQFIDDLNVVYEDGTATGTYTWNQADARMAIALNNGYRFDITIPYGSDQATVVFNGPNEPQTDIGTYTLQ